MTGNKKASGLGHYTGASIVTILIIGLAAIFGGGHVIVPIVALALIEVTFSFENAVVNSQVLGRLNAFWRKMFLTVGIAVAVFGVRLILPLVLVSTTSGHSLGFVLDSALHHPDVYARELLDAYPIIAAFGGVFLLMIGLRFFGEQKEVKWLNTIEAPLAEFNQPWWITSLGSLLAVLVIYKVLAPHDNRIALAGLFGAITFVVIKLLSQLLVRGTGDSKHSGWTQFLYLELLDASFSFDGVIAAFAITKEVLLIAAGLGIGALYVRSMTMHLLKGNTLAHYRYLVHGAHYAILALSVLLLASIRLEIPELLSGVIGLVIIGAAFEHSRRHNNRTLSV